MSKRSLGKPRLEPRAQCSPHHSTILTCGCGIQWATGSRPSRGSLLLSLGSEPFLFEPKDVHPAPAPGLPCSLTAPITQPDWELLFLMFAVFHPGSFLLLFPSSLHGAGELLPTAAALRPRPGPRGCLVPRAREGRQGRGAALLQQKLAHLRTPPGSRGTEGR